MTNPHSDLTFFVPGTPAPQGSKNAYRRGQKIVLVESSKKVKPWRDTVSTVARFHCKTVLDAPVAVYVEFIMPRPKSLPKKVDHMVKKPDLDKCIRSTLDALSGIAYMDDNRVNEIHAWKRYQKPGEQTGAKVKIAINSPVDPFKNAA